MAWNDIAAALLMLAAQVALIVVVVRLARRAHRADDLGHGEYAWSLPVAFAAFTAVAALARLPRWATGTFHSLPEFVLVTGGEIAAGVLLVDFARRAHAERHGAPPHGVKTAGVLLVAAALLSTLILFGGPFFIYRIHVMEALGAGLLAWGIVGVATIAHAEPSTPSWVPALATFAGQVLLVGLYVRAFIVSGLLVGGGDVANLRFVHAGTWLLAAALAAPAFGCAGRSLLAPKPTPAPTPPKAPEDSSTA